jgi:hypothetical protein
MRTNTNKVARIKAGLAASVLLLAAGTASAQSTINLTAAPQFVTMPDGTVMPMWGLVCGTGTATTAGGTGTPAPVNNDTATGTAVLSTTTLGTVGSITVNNPGLGYTAVPTVTISGGGGTSAAATAAMGVGAIPVTVGGTGYSSATPPAVTIPAPTATSGTITQAVATATVSSTGVVTGIVVTTAGSGYLSPPTVSIAAPTAGTAATLGTPTLTVTGVAVTAGGSGYTAAPTVAFSGGGGPGALAAASCTQTNGIGQSAGTAGTVANPAGSISTVWQPPLITVPYSITGTSLTINLTNSLRFQPPTPTGGAVPPANTVPTSLTIVGQLGGGLGTPTAVASPTHSGQTSVTWATQTAASFTPPSQGNRVQSFGTEVAATGATLGTGQVASGSALTWSNLLPGTYLIESGTHPSIQGPMGLYGVLVVTTAPTSSTSGATTTYTAGTAYPAIGTTPAVTYGAEVAQLFSEIDPVQNIAVNAAVNTAGFGETKVWSGMPGSCGNQYNANGSLNSGTTAGPTPFGTCYPPAANYTPIYYMIDGLAFNGTLPSASLLPALPGTAAAPVSGTVLVRMVNAGLRMHVPAIVGSQTTTTYTSGTTTTTTTPNGFSLIAEDGNPLPGVPRVQSEVFMAAGKTYDVMINVPAATSPPLAVYDRELSLSGNQIERNAGMLAYIGVNGAALPTTGAFSTAAGGGAAPGKANPDTYNSVVAGQTLTVSDPSKGVIANDVNVYGVKILGGSATTVGGAAATTMTSTNGTLTLMANGTFAYQPTAAAGTAFPGDTFTYCANGTVTAAIGTTPATCSSGITATITLGAATLEAASGITCTASSYTAATATYLAVKPPGVLAGCKDAAGYPLKVATTPAPTSSSGTLTMDSFGGFNLSVAAAGVYTITFTPQNSQGTPGSATTASVTFPAGSGLKVTVLDGSTKAAITDYRWIIEEDRTFYVDPNCTSNPPPAGCPTANIPGLGTTTGIVPALGLNFHTSYMPYVAQGCTGLKSCEYGQMMVDNNPASPTYLQHVTAVCDVGDGVCRPDGGNGTTAGGSTWVDPSQVVLNPTKRYYISVFPGDAADPFYGANTVGHGMAGAPIPALACKPNATGTTVCTWPVTGATCTPAAGQTICVPANGTAPPYPYGVTAVTQPSPYQTAQLSVFVFEDDAPLNGEHDSLGGVAGVNTNLEPGLGQFQIHLWDAMAGNGDFTGQMGFDMFNQPLSNSLAGTKDPLNGKDACPIVVNPLSATTGANPTTLSTDPTATGMTGFIVTCPEYESDGVTPSPLAGQAVIRNLMPGRWGVIATPGADRIARGEEWLQTNTLDGQKALDSFTRIGEPSYFQEYGPAGFHVSIGFANPAIINARKPSVCAGTDPTGLGPYNCNNTLKGRIVSERLSRTPDERLYGSGSHDAFAWTQCYVSVGDPDGVDFAFTKCDADGNFTLTGLPDGDWRITTFDQWNDQLVDGLSTPVRLSAGATAATTNIGDIAATQWETNLYTKTFIDDNKDGIAQSTETGIPFANVAVRLRDGSLENLLVTDFTGTANFNETFPLFSWYVVETDVTRYKNTGTHVVYDVGGPADGSTFNINGTSISCTPAGTGGYPPCGTSTIAKFLANTAETISLPTNLRVPGAVYCAGADCAGKDMSGLVGSKTSDPISSCQTATTAPYATTCSTTLSSGRIDPPWIGVEGWQGFPGQSSFMEFGKAPYYEGENGGIHGHVVYASTRPFDDPMMLVQTQWTPLIPHVTINLYQEGFAADGVTPTLTLVDTTQTSSFDEWAQGFRSDGVPYMNCPGQGGSTGVAPDLFFFSLYNQPQYLDFYNSQHGGAAPTTLPNNSQFKCYDGMHNWNQVEPAPYDGMYQFPSVNSRNPTSGASQPISAAIAAISEAGSTVTVNTTTTHGLVSGALVNIAGASTGYNSADAANTGGSTSPKLFAISVTGPKSFSYTVPTTGLAAGTAGTVSALATNCTICINDPVPASGVDADPLRAGQKMLPKGKYVVEVVLPPSFELVKEEDKNILIGDNFIAPVTQQFGGMGNIFIMPDQASVATFYTAPGIGFNANTNSCATFPSPTCAGNGVNPTQSFGASPSNGIVPSFVPEPTWPCVGEARIVPDYISMFPQSKQVAPFAGATRRLCDRKEVTLSDQMGASAKFWLYTSTHIASKFTGGITDDYTSEFDPFSPQFGEKFAPPDLPVSLKDFSGTEISRVYADHWGAYDGMTYSTWEVNPPNPTGYSPTMMVVCMNDPGPILDTRQTVLNPAGAAVANPTLGQMITDPQFTPGYSQFCYELPFMPGTTQYLDTPVVPTSAFAGAGYNNADCAYPDATPAIKEVDGDQIGPWVSAAGSTLTITALGDQMVPNHAYVGPSGTRAPYNQKMVRRHYGFGTQATAVAGGAGGSVLIGGVPATVSSWSDSKIQVTVPSGVPPCLVQQQQIYGGPAPTTPALCGELVVTTATTQAGGQVTGVTITRGGRYNTAPSVTFTGGGGTGAAGTAVLGGAGGIGPVTVTAGGSYTSTPNVTFSDGAGTGAIATATMRRRVTSVAITNPGRYSATTPATITATFSGAGGAGTAATGTVVTASDVVFNVTINSSGSGYPAGTTASFTGGGCTTEPTAGTVNRNGAGGITGVTITSGGIGCTSAPAISFTPAHPAGATLATATANLGRRVVSVTITNPTTNNYAVGATPTVTFSVTGGGGTRALGTVATSEYVSAVTVNSAGTNYTNPTVNFVCPTATPNCGSGAAATTTVVNRAVVSVTITNPGTGYTTVPTVTFSPGLGGATGRALGTATINPLATFAGRQSIDTVTVTIGGAAPTHVPATGTIQSAIDAAAPGDLIIIDPTCTTIATGAAAACSSAAVDAATPTQSATQAAHSELLIMWKPVRLQGVGAASTVVNATTHPAGDLKLTQWRQKIDCLFGLGLNSSPVTTAASGTVPPNPYDPAGQVSCPWAGVNYFNAYPTATNPFNPQVDRLPLEAVVGWDANLNGNLAELLQEPSLMGALEGAGITVLGKGVNFLSNPYDPTLLAGFPTGTKLLQDTMSNPNGATCLDSTGAHNPFPSNFSCNPSSIDGLTITQGSQGGGGIFVHGWGHNLQIANNRIYSNAGTLSGGINVGQGEFAPPYIQGAGNVNAAPGSCEESPVAGSVLPYCENVNVDIHHNNVSLNSSTGDELFSATPAGAGGVSICTGADYYKFNYNWVCGNLSNGDGGGLGHLGYSSNGDIEHNTILFNQSTNPTIPSNGGGMIIMGTPDVDVICPTGSGIVLDLDCALGTAANILANAYSPSDGVGPGLVINANLIMGNAAESGAGGGIAFQAVNGSDMVAFPDDPGQWNSVTLTNNIIVDNVAGWDGAGVSLLDSPNVNIINNTIAFNASTASSGTLFNTLQAPLASTKGPTCTTGCGSTSAPQVAGVVAQQHSVLLSANLAATPVVCPPGHYQGSGTNAATNGACRFISYPKLENNIIWQNASYYIGVGALSSQFQQNVISLFNAFTGAAAPTQTTTGQCAARSYWDVGVRGDTGPTNHNSTFTLTATDSVLTAGGSAVLGGGNSPGNPNFVRFYCDGSRTPPEFGASGWAVPTGISDATVPNPIFNLTPVATVDEGNNWVNLRWGPLSMTNPTVLDGPNSNYGGSLPLGDYRITTGSSATGRVGGGGGGGGGGTNFADAPAYDFFDKPRKTGGSIDAGAVKLTGTPGGQFTVSASVIDFGFVPHGCCGSTAPGAMPTVDQDIVVTNSDVVPITITGAVINCSGIGGGGTCNTASFSLAPANQPDYCTGPLGAGVVLGAGQSCMLTVVFNPTSSSQAARNASLVITAGGLSQTVSLTGHDSIATVAVSATTVPAGTPALVATPPNTVAVTGTITVTNTSTRCSAAGPTACTTTGIPAGYPAPSVDAGPFIPTAITLTPTSGTGTWAIGGTCAVGTAINPGLAAIAAGPVDPTTGQPSPPASNYVPSGNCTVTATYTPPTTCATATASCPGSATITVQGYGTAGATQPATILTRVINAN